MTARWRRAGWLGFALGLATGIASCAREESVEEFEARMAASDVRAEAALAAEDADGGARDAR